MKEKGEGGEEEGEGGGGLERRVRVEEGGEG